MCTICGHFVQGGHICSSDIYDMLKKMDHRGPDTHGVYLDNETHRARKVDDLREELVRDAH
ncbi:MAG: hypothetical protein KUA39_20365, partial [Desulfarculus sp.]|nr:hypothetical protein [Pseudomonadota bacterium]MBV1753982.1 hypothetical protein [Desulfarculus sp.]